MSMFDLSGLFDDPDTYARNQADQVAALNALQEKVEAAVGEATSDDERIHVTWSEGEGLRELDLNPRALRLPSDELAAQIRDVVNRAREDANTKIAAVLQDMEDVPTLADTKTMIDEMPKVQGFLDDALRDTSRLGEQLEQLVEQMQARTGVDPDQFADDEADDRPGEPGQGRSSAT